MKYKSIDERVLIKERKSLILTRFLALAVFAYGIAFSSPARANHEDAAPSDVLLAELDGFDPHTECEFSDFRSTGETGRVCAHTVAADELVAITAGVVAGVTLLSLGIVAIWLLSSGSDDDFEFVQWKTLEGDTYLPTRSWVGVEQNLTREVKISLGIFWAKGDSAESLSPRDLFPSEDNIGLEFASAYQAPRWGEFSLASAVYHQNSIHYNKKNNGVPVGSLGSVGVGSDLDTRLLLRWKSRW